MILTGANPDVRNQERESIADSARQHVDGLLSCARAHPVDGSDLVGAVKAAENKLDANADQQRVVLVSDGVQATNELTFASDRLPDPAWRKSVLETLRAQDLLPDLGDVEFVITDLGAGATHLTASQAQGLHDFWADYAIAANTTLG
jgi:hypothetical protein